MRGTDSRRPFLTLSPERFRVKMVDIALPERSGIDYSDTGRRSIPPEKLLRAFAAAILYSIRSERMLCEQLDYNLLFRWFIVCRG